MEDPIWFVFQNKKQLGPFDLKQVQQMLDTNMITQNAFLFKIGWKDWRKIEDCNNELGRPPVFKLEPPSDPNRLGPRGSIKGRIIVHNNGQLVIGSGVNISASGVFIEMNDQIFKIGEVLKLTCRVDGFIRAFNCEAEVMRFNNDERFSIGYGLKFTKLDRDIKLEIQRILDVENADVAV